VIRVLVVDDEPLARAGLCEWLAAEPDMELVGESATGVEAIAAIRRERPDLALLDVALPEADGFQILAALPPDEMPLVVFITAHDRYALQAFDAHAVDYLLKPVEQQRFRRALGRARERLRSRDRDAWPERLTALLQELRAPPRYPLRLAVRTVGRTYFVPTAEIDWIEAAGNYARLHVGRIRHVMRDTLTNLEKELDPARFCRVHRSAIVNLERVREIQPGDRGDQRLILTDGTRLVLSATHRARFEERSGKPR
jgi:two-component system LytT family response regulator